MEINPLISS